MKKKILATLAASAVVLGGAVLAAPSAQAAQRNGVCEAGEVCLYYNSGMTGSMVDLASNVATYGTGTSCIKFISAGAGRGLCVKNNAASVRNRSSVLVTIFRKSSYAGSIDVFGASSAGNLNANLKNNNAGHLFGIAGKPMMETSLYRSTTGRISAYFDGYINTSGRHEGIDFARGESVPVYSLVSGTVISKVEGSTSSLSTISIYNSSLNASVIYLHTDPQVSVGQTISAGQRIAIEDNRAGGAFHTHVELRPGRKTSAAKSVGDPTLDNPIPTSWWRARGYNLCCD